MTRKLMNAIYFPGKQCLLNWNTIHKFITYGDTKTFLLIEMVTNLNMKNDNANDFKYL